MNVLKDVLFTVLRVGARLPHDRASILMYHSVADDPEHFNSVSLQMFARQMEYLAAKHFDVIRLSELTDRLRERRALSRAVVLTFDDGYQNNFTAAFPILKRYQFPATVFVVTGRIGSKDTKSGFEYLRENELRDMEATGLIDIEPHTVSHPKLAQLSSGSAREEVAASKVVVEKILGKRSRTFAYPYGSYNDATVRLVREGGFEAAVTVREGTVHRESRLFELPRNSIDTSTTFTQFRGKVSRAVDRYEYLKNLLHV